MSAMPSAENGLLEILVERLTTAERRLSNTACKALDAGNYGEAMRLAGKAEGVRFALSYVEELQRQVRAVPPGGGHA